MYATAAEWAEVAASETINARKDWSGDHAGVSFGPSEYVTSHWRDEADSEGGRWAEMVRMGRAMTSDAVLLNPANHCFRENSTTDLCASCGVRYSAHTGCDCDDLTPSERAYGLPDIFSRIDATVYIPRTDG